ncbi:ATP-binding cassette domain-containing protein [Dyadobacter subterraneus]|uniref:ATP-binding cassette domain-containing protein n=1 Tax=Dyadobacter subterraneus TaxID=2773304 RepID=A0ABR9WFL1_9BACT|nr:ATP-binding cassette domain-containing protein [Dyadobacter subterraneus]MBE9464294.1 ATP-binding cassette domain-containing protein [Dyadobacter subterraneus]
MIQLDHVTFGYSKQKNIFTDLSLKLHPGHIYGLLGKNGAGKSSLLRNMAGLLFPCEGTIEVLGREPRRREPAFLQDIFFLPEEIYLPSVTIEKYVDTLSPFYPKFDKNQFLGYIAEFDIPEGNKLTGMSYGQKKKVLIAFALATNTKVLIMDEPTNGLDIPSKSQFRKVVTSVLDSERLILISTHQVRDLDNLIDSIIIIEDSKILIQHSLDVVAERLCFGTLPNVEYDQRVIYSVPSLRGYNAVFENSEQRESRVDLEQLFNAVIENPARIQSIFN